MNPSNQERAQTRIIKIEFCQKPTLQGLAIRPAEPSDINLIYSTWLRSYQKESPSTNFIRFQEFYPRHQIVLDKLLSRKNVQVAVACDGSDPDVVFGWIAWAPEVLHYWFVKVPFRSIGIGQELIKHVGVDFASWRVTHVTYSLISLLKTGKIGYIDYNPYLLEKE